MRIMQHPVFRRFWYPTLELGEFSAEPRAFTLLGENIVLWRQADGSPAALQDRCPHRRAKLSVDSVVVDGTLQCGYHGWRFGGDGRCLRVPQMPELEPGPRYNAKRFNCQARYGYAWVCLEDDPLQGIPFIPHSDDPAYRQIFEYAQDWDANMLVIAENALDLTHVSYVHRRTLGNDTPVAPKLNVTSHDDGVSFNCSIPVANHALQQKNLRIAETETVRTVDIRWTMPGTFILKFTYPNGLVHQICGFATPIDDERSRRIQFVYRSDTESDAPGDAIGAFDRSVGQEDRLILESCGGDFILNPALMAHMATDRPNLIMRRVLSDLISNHDANADLVSTELADAGGVGESAF
jgi:phenylpropionate dioxygenase-like ring-hydroxylating dioxygenase large terminal subunit